MIEKKVSYDMKRCGHTVWKRGREMSDMTLETEKTAQLPAEDAAPVNPEENPEILRLIDEGLFIPYEKSLIGLLFFRKDHRGAHTRIDPTND